RCAGRGERHRGAKVVDAPRIRLVNAGDNLDQRRFSRPILPDQGMHFAGGQGKVDAVERQHTGETLGDAAQLQQCLSHGMRWSSGAPYRCPAPTRKGRLLSLLCLLSLLGLLSLTDPRGSVGRPSRLRRLRRPSRRGSAMRISQRKFEALVERALGTIPAEIRRRMDNVEIVVDEWPDEAHYGTVGLEPGETLFGLYEGVPLIERGIVADP